MFLPTSRDISTYLRSGNWTYESLYNQCVVSRHNCFDAGTAMLTKLEPSKLREIGICEYFCFNSLTTNGHYNEKGNELLAKVFVEYLRNDMHLSNINMLDLVH